MQRQKPSEVPNSSVPTPEPAHDLPEQSTANLPASQSGWLTQVMSRLSIGSKISCGYVLAVGIGILGTTAGLAIGNHYHERAVERREYLAKEGGILDDLYRAMSQSRMHQQQFASLLRQPEVFKKEHGHFLGHMAEMNKIFAELKADATTSDIKGLKEFIQTYENSITDFCKRSEALIYEIDVPNLKPDKIPKAQQVLLEFTNGDTANKFDDFADGLEEFVKVVDGEEQAAVEDLHRANVLRSQIIIVSTTLSALIAAILAFVISRTITSPIRTLTTVAQRATKESNFNVFAPVTSADEIGVLTISFNQLIQWVAEYTQELNIARQTLEKRVEERTEELSQKHQQLQQAHEQISQTLKDLQQAQTKLVQGEKMSSLGQLVAGVAHEINNPVNFIYGNLTHAHEYTQDLLNLVEIYQQHYPNPLPEVQAVCEEIDLDFLIEDLPKLLSSMKVGADRIQKIVISLRNFSRMDEADMKAVNIHEGIDSTLMILQNRLKAKPDRPAIQLIKEYGNLPLVECYAGQLNQVFMNIITNALDALDERDSKRSPQDLKQNPSTIRISTERVKEDRVMIRIADNGPGIPEEIQQRLFDPFFTTKAIGKGTGLGLSISYQIVTEKHGGQLQCISSSGQGTDFLIEIPIQQS